MSYTQIQADFSRKFRLGISALWISSIVLLAVCKWGALPQMSLNEWGDFLAGVSAPLALFWLVIGYFQHGEELRLNTEALKAQQEELRRQVEETAVLAKNAERQAHASERLVQINKADQEREARREVRAAQPDFVAEGGGTKGVELWTNILNRGAEAQDVEVHYDGVYALEINPQVRFESRRKGILAVRQPRAEPLVFPIAFRLSYTDALGVKRTRAFELRQNHELRDLGEMQTVSDPEA